MVDLRRTDLWAIALVEVELVLLVDFIKPSF